MRKTGLLAALAALLLTLSACVVEPYEGRHYEGHHYHGDHYHDDGHRVWHE